MRVQSKQSQLAHVRANLCNVIPPLFSPLPTPPPIVQVFLHLLFLLFSPLIPPSPCLLHFPLSPKTSQFLPPNPSPPPFSPFSIPFSQHLSLFHHHLLISQSLPPLILPIHILLFHCLSSSSSSSSTVSSSASSSTSSSTSDWGQVECGMRIARDADVRKFLVVGVTKSQLERILNIGFRLGIVHARNTWFIVVPTGAQVWGKEECQAEMEE